MEKNQINTSASLDKETKVRESINFYRGFILDSVEIYLGQEPCWKAVRSNILKALGQQGLEQKIIQILKDP